MDNPTSFSSDNPNKRPRSPSGELAHLPSKAARTQSQHLQINYLQRQYNDNIPLVTSDQDNLPTILRLIGDYDGVLQRHESIAGNLGACPLGPILIKRFERLFDGPPRILKSHGKETGVSWLDVVEFARNKPEQFNLEKTRNGIRVCQFYTKQCRVEISEEDFVLISSGMPQKLIPPQPIIEDEEKELGALEILEKNLIQIIQLSDQVSARARQLNHRLKNRKAAINSRRENEAAISKAFARIPTPPAFVPSEPPNGNNVAQPNGTTATGSPKGGFTAVNVPQGMSPDILTNNIDPTSVLGLNTDKVTIINGTDLRGASRETRDELMKRFFSTSERSNSHTMEEDIRRASPSVPRPTVVPARTTRPRADSLELRGSLDSPSGAGAVAIPSTPASLLPHTKPTVTDRDDGGPYKSEMVIRMESINRGERIIPPCDRCRRLHMDCLKNLTACMGCTKKHAKCSWKDVRESELREADRMMGRSIGMESLDESMSGEAPASAVQTDERQPQMEMGLPNEKSASPQRPNGMDDSHYERSKTPEKVEPVSPAMAVEEAKMQIPTQFATPSAPASVESERIPSKPFEKQLQEAAADAPFRRIPRVEVPPRQRYQAEEDDDDDDEGDRLQAAAAQVYRSASQQGMRT
ncbi:MAG: hypothetical protein Q9160_002660 [Pyrenula sp. 1 TL-2023]